ncbi:MAG TPA: phosphoribosylamine--glycine ligase [Anaerolineales bacterium]|nr:phosphoribosylamine--glycine ligase [Anaerolineales bacterium]
MRILLVGSGGREHALAWKLTGSPRLEQLWVAPGNAGTARLDDRVKNVAIAADDVDGLVAFASTNAIGLAVIGPEAPLARGLGDALRSTGIAVFGPNRAAAEIESSKAFSKDFMARHGIPTARYGVFRDHTEALRHLLSIDYPVVIKASGLAAGKGVIVPACADEAEAALRQIMLDREFGEAGDEAVIEERLTGPEVSVLAFSDGHTVRVMPPAQDHKRVGDGDTGLNTGGMGAYAPAPIATPELIADVTRSVLQTTIDGLRAEDRPFVGVLYAGLMLTPDGPRVLEFNARFGDPETQVILPLLESDLVEVLLACAEGRLGDIDVNWSQGAAACVVMASEGYPGPYPKDLPIAGLDQATTDAFVFHAGTRELAEQVVTAGGRVLAVSGWGVDIRSALDRAYAAVGSITFAGMHFRRDIGWRALVRGAGSAGARGPGASTSAPMSS